MVVWIGTHDQLGDQDAQQAASDDANCLDPDGGGVILGQVADDQPAECAQECTQEVRVSVALPGETVGVFGLWEVLEYIIQIVGPEKQPCIVQKSKHCLTRQSD